MKSPAVVITSSPETVLTTLAWIRRQGYKAVPVAFRGKAAMPEDWQKPTYTPPDDDHWRKRAMNVGVLTGPERSGPVDIDLDCDEAVKLAPHFLPPTQAIFGRPGKPRSHYLYKIGPTSTRCPYITYQDPTRKKDKTVLELRADDGHQTVLPGSVHESGELIEWSAVPFPDPAVVETDILIEATKRLSVACLIARYLWSPGNRNANLLPLSGLFYHIGWSEAEAVAMISTVMGYHGDKDKSRIPTIRKTFQRASEGALIQGAGALRKGIPAEHGQIVDRIMHWVGPPEASIFMQYNERFCVVNAGGKFRVAETDVTPGSAPVFYQKSDFLGLYGTEKADIDGERVSVAGMWLGSGRRRVCHSVDFLPGQEDTGSILNLWTGWAVKPDKDKSCKAWLELLHDTMCGGDEALYNWMLNWFANIVRDPLNKPLTAPVIIGPQGAGKSLLLDYFGQILGKAYTTVTNPDHLTGQFNAHTANTLLLHSEEALFGGERKHRGIIKSLITDSSRMFEQKGIDARPIANHLRLVMTSNEKHAAPAEADDRRFTVLDLKKRKDTKLARRVVAEMKSGGPAGLFAFLLEFPYDIQVVRTNVKNDALASLKMRGTDPIEGWWMEKLMSGVLLPDYLRWAQVDTEAEWPEVFGSVTFYQYAINTIRGLRYIPNAQTFYETFYDLIDARPKKSQRTFINTAGLVLDHPPTWVTLLPGYQNAIRGFPSIEHCREAYCRRMGHQIEWPDDEPEEEKPAYKKDKTKAPALVF